MFFADRTQSFSSGLFSVGRKTAGGGKFLKRHAGQAGPTEIQSAQETIRSSVTLLIPKKFHPIAATLVTGGIGIVATLLWLCAFESRDNHVLASWFFPLSSLVVGCENFSAWIWYPSAFCGWVVIGLVIDYLRSVCRFSSPFTKREWKLAMVAVLVGLLAGVLSVLAVYAALIVWVLSVIIGTTTFVIKGGENRSFFVGLFNGSVFLTLCCAMLRGDSSYCSDLFIMSVFLFLFLVLVPMICASSVTAKKNEGCGNN